VLKRIARVVFNPGAEEPIILLHGVFGSGKSTLLVR
jgi:tRNA A37 threonylcarbamoyladenosine biosynthesis protein TsaE